jgi:pimeloyl-ACP methyl ester carboxylesterase
MRHERAGFGDFDMGEALMADGVRLNFLRCGAGAPLVLIHSVHSTLRDWTISALIPLLSQNHEVIAFDRPGAGLSGWPGHAGVRLTEQARLMRVALRKMGIERPTVVGHGYGGAVGLAWALDAPDRIKGLVTLAAPSHPWRGGVGFLYGLLANDVTGPLLAQTLPGRMSAVRGDTARAFSPFPPPRGYLAGLGGERLLRPNALRSNAAQMEALPAQLRIMAGRYADLQTPVEILHGEADAILPAGRHAVRLAAKAPRSQLTLLPDVGHMIHHAAPREVAAAVARLADS